MSRWWPARLRCGKYLRGDYIAPESRRLVREALGISNDEAAHLGLSDFSTETCQGRRDIRTRGGAKCSTRPSVLGISVILRQVLWRASSGCCHRNLP